MDSDFRFLVPVTRPSNRHGRRDCSIWVGPETFTSDLQAEEEPAPANAGAVAPAE